jgi:hypothetical protein
MEMNREYVRIVQLKESEKGQYLGCGTSQVRGPA